mgnify:FL=1
MGTLYFYFILAMFVFFGMIIFGDYTFYVAGPTFVIIGICLGLLGAIHALDFSRSLASLTGNLLSVGLSIIITGWGWSMCKEAWSDSIKNGTLHNLFRNEIFWSFFWIFVLLGLVSFWISYTRGNKKQL